MVEDGNAEDDEEQIRSILFGPGASSGIGAEDDDSLQQELTSRAARGSYQPQ